MREAYLKDIRKLSFSDNHYARYAVYLGKLLSNETLPPEALDHPLKGDYTGFREFHVSGDLLVIYYATDTKLVLVRIGSHSQLFD